MLHLVDTNSELVRCWEESFAGLEGVWIQHADLLKVAHTCVVSPANSYGFMDGGIDQMYLSFFGRGIEDRVREAVLSRPEGYLPVGASLLIPTGHLAIPNLVLAPTMLMPERVETANAYRAMRAVLRIMNTANLREVFCPGLGTGVGSIPPQEAAKMMADAYLHWQKENR